MGLTQHKNAVDTIKEIVNLLLLKGSIGKPGSGTCPVRGHSNVQGDRTMGIYEKPSIEFLNNIEKAFGFKPPQKQGFDTVEAIHAMHEEKQGSSLPWEVIFYPLHRIPDLQLKPCKNVSLLFRYLPS